MTTTIPFYVPNITAGGVQIGTIWEQTVCRELVITISCKDCGSIGKLYRVITITTKGIMLNDQRDLHNYLLGWKSDWWFAVLTWKPLKKLDHLSTEGISKLEILRGSKVQETTAHSGDPTFRRVTDGIEMTKVFLNCRGCMIKLSEIIL